MGKINKLLPLSIILGISLGIHTQSCAWMDKPQKGRVKIQMTLSHINTNRYYDGNGDLHHSPYINFAETRITLGVECNITAFFSLFAKVPFVQRTGSTYIPVYFVTDTGAITMDEINLSVRGSGLGDVEAGVHIYLDKSIAEYLKEGLFIRPHFSIIYPTGDSTGEYPRSLNPFQDSVKLPTGTGQADYRLGILVGFKWKILRLVFDYTYTIRTATKDLTNWIAYLLPDSIDPGDRMDFLLKADIFLPEGFIVNTGIRHSLLQGFNVKGTDLITGQYLDYNTTHAVLTYGSAGIRYSHNSKISFGITFHFPITGKNYPEASAYATSKDPYRVNEGVRDFDGLYLTMRDPVLPGFYTVADITYEY